MTDNNGNWRSEYILAALKASGWNYATLGVANGLGKATLRNAVRACWPKGEKIIADAIGVEAQTIWPSRYKGVVGSVK
ncbi:transcriptional regulator [Agarivorans sp. B2Z047]|nr:transcriptional regulator [Agarivorans sp. B2Z047]